MVQDLLQPGQLDRVHDGRLEVFQREVTIGERSGAHVKSLGTERGWTGVLLFGDI